MIRLYGVDEENYIVRTDAFKDHVSDDELKTMADWYKREFCAVEVWAMFVRPELNDAWRDYCRDGRKRNGLGDYARFEFVDYLRSGEWRIDK